MAAPAKLLGLAPASVTTISHGVIPETRGISHLARASITDLQTKVSRIAVPVRATPQGDWEIVRIALIKWGFVAIPPKGEVPLPIFLQMSPEQMKNHLETVQHLTPNALSLLNREQLLTVLPHLSLDLFKSHMLALLKPLETKVLKEVPLEFLVKWIDSFKQERAVYTDIYYTIKNVVVAYVTAPANKTLDYSKEQELLSKLLELGIFRSVTSQEAQTFPRSFYEALTDAHLYKSTHWHSGNEHPFGEHCLTEMPLDLVYRCQRISFDSTLTIESPGVVQGRSATAPPMEIVKLIAKFASQSNISPPDWLVKLVEKWPTKFLEVQSNPFFKEAFKKGLQDLHDRNRARYSLEDLSLTRQQLRTCTYDQFKEWVNRRFISSLSDFSPLYDDIPAEHFIRLEKEAKQANDPVLLNELRLLHFNGGDFTDRYR